MKIWSAVHGKQNAVVRAILIFALSSLIRPVPVGGGCCPSECVMSQCLDPEHSDTSTAIHVYKEVDAVLWAMYVRLLEPPYPAARQRVRQSTQRLQHLRAQPRLPPRLQLRLHLLQILQLRQECRPLPFLPLPEECSQDMTPTLPYICCSVASPHSYHRMPFMFNGLQEFLMDRFDYRHACKMTTWRREVQLNAVLCRSVAAPWPRESHLSFASLVAQTLSVHGLSGRSTSLLVGCI